MSDIVVRLEVVDGVERGVVIEADEEAEITPELLAELALGRGNDADVSDNVLTVGVAGHGLGRVKYHVGEQLPSRNYRLKRMGDD